jgi:hypothetical protein
MKNMKLFPSKIFYFFMSFITFMVKIKHYRVVNGSLGATINENRAKNNSKVCPMYVKSLLI